MKQIILLCSLLLLVGHAGAQNLLVPNDFDASKTTDFSKYNLDVLNCIKWLETTPMDKEETTRRSVNKFLLEWITGSPDVSISLKREVVTFSEKNPGLITVYMGGWTRYAIQSGNYRDSLNGNMAGIRSVIKVYKANPQFTKDLEIEKLIALDKKGELEKWEAEQMTK
jgi:hypothetical protein